MRILSGLYKGRNLLPPPGQATTRPITGLVKKSLFGMLGENLPDQTIVDLFCGTGTLGIEALSRGARRCYFAEMDPRVVERLRRNLDELGASARGVIWRGEVEHQLRGWLRAVDAPIDVAFVDPPYDLARKWDWASVAERIFAPLAERLAPDGVVVLRTSADAELPADFAPLEVGRTRTYGDMVLTMLVRPEEPGEGADPEPER